MTSNLTKFSLRGHDESWSITIYCTRGLFALAMVGTLSGCALTSSADRQSLFNPPGIHASTDEKSGAVVAGQIPITQYYAALDIAKDKPKGTDEISDFVDKGIGLTSAYCLRWFQRLDEVQRRLDLQEKDFNVIRQLGTAFLGIGKAIPNWVTGYGAANTAYSGIAENFNEAILAGPTTAKIKSRVLDMLQQSEITLRRDAKRLTFTQAYNRIELHADTCTYSTVRNLLDATLASTQPTRDPKTGGITIRSLQPATGIQIITMEKITSRVAALTEDHTKLAEINNVLKEVGAPKFDFDKFEEAKNALIDEVDKITPNDTPKWARALGLKATEITEKES
ncbi:MAG: hypothetical protein NUV75_13075 [Gallionella sp.]|nr:hypothetical protein [Gallionella sp.]